MLRAAKYCTRSCLSALVVLSVFLGAFGQTGKTRVRSFDVIINGGTIYDGSGKPGIRADVGISGDRVAAVGNLKNASAGTVVDATGLAVAPGFINMLSWSVDSLIVDGRSMGELKQGITTQIFGEGDSMGP